MDMMKFVKFPSNLQSARALGTARVEGRGTVIDAPSLFLCLFEVCTLAGKLLTFIEISTFQFTHYNTNLLKCTNSPKLLKENTIQGSVSLLQVRLQAIRTSWLSIPNFGPKIRKQFTKFNKSYYSLPAPMTSLRRH
jgi:hypothetical protein